MLYKKIGVAQLLFSGTPLFLKYSDRIEGTGIPGNQVTNGNRAQENT
jgi:hypothetical protein